MSLKEQFERIDEIPQRRILIYGEGGIGKSTWASEAPSPIFLASRGEHIKVPGVEAYAMKGFDDLLKALADDDLAKADTLVLDNLTGFEEALIRDVEEEHRADFSDSKFEFGRGAKALMKRYRRLIQGLEYATEKHNLHLILIAHADVNRVTPPDSEPYFKYDLVIEKRARQVFDAWCTDILFARYQENVFKEQGQLTARISGGKQRELVTHGQATARAKVKHLPGIPEVIPLSWSEFAKYIPQKKKEVSDAARSS